LTSAEAASGIEVNIPWNQKLNLIDAESTGVTKTFSYRLVPAQSNAPAPVEATDGVYTFKATGTQSGQMKLHFNFPSAGYYTYKVDAYVPDRKAGYTYETETYTVMVMAVYGDDGSLKLGALTIQDDRLAKYDSIPLVVTYRGKAVPDTDKPDDSGKKTDQPDDTEKTTDKPDNTGKTTDKPDNTKTTDVPDDDNNTDTTPSQRTPSAAGTPVSRPNTTTVINRYVTPAVPGTTAVTDDTDDADEGTEPETAEEPEEETDPGTDIGENRTPQAAPNIGDGTEDTEESWWALLNLLCMIATASICGSMLGFYLYKKNKKKKEEEEKVKQLAKATGADPKTAGKPAKAGKKIGKRMLFHLLAIVPAAAAIIVFVLTEDITLPMKWVDRWTLPMILILVIEVVLEILAILRVKHKNDKGNRKPARAAGNATPAR
jgi:hypothetical protein